MKNNFTILVFILMIITSCKENVNDKFYNDNLEVSSKVKQIANKIDDYGELTGSAVGYSGNKPEQWDNFIELKKTASDNELVLLTNHPSTVVRCYAFDLLKNKKHKDVFDILSYHLKDTATIYTQSGCIGNESSVSDYMLGSIFNLPDENFYLSKEKKKVIDSLIIYNNNITNIYKDGILENITPEDKFYNKIRELAVKGNNSAIIGLAKFQKEEDKHLISSLLKNERTDIQTYGIKSVINYPSLDFLPILKKIQSREIKGQGGFDYILLRYLYQAIVQYKNESSRNILENTISNVNESAKTYHYEYVWLAVKKYPNSIYKGIIEELNYTDYEIKNLEFDWDWEIRNLY